MSTSGDKLKTVGLSGSPSPGSRSKILLDHTLVQLATKGVDVQLLDLTELPADALLGRCKDPAVYEAVQHASQAAILLLATPIYRATYTGQLKAFLDLFPQNALRGVVVGLLATGGSPHHALAIDHGLRPLVASLGGLSAARAIYVTDAEFPDKEHLTLQLSNVITELADELYQLAQGLALAGAGTER